MDSPYLFQSFIPSTEGQDLPDFVLEIYQLPGCAGAVTNLSMGAGQLSDNECSFHGGNSVRFMMDALQSISDNAGTSQEEPIRRTLG